MNNLFLNADCMDPEVGIPSYPDNYFDLAIVDPPYGIGAGLVQRGGKRHGNSLAVSKEYDKKNWDNHAPLAIYFKQLRRVSKHQIVWGANHFISKLPVDSSCWIVWDKVNGNNGYADCELAWTSFKSAVRKAKFRWHGMLQQDMKNKENRIHPTQKPVALYRWLIQNYANPDDLILDTHVGSASSLVAFEGAGFNYVGYELDPDYYAAAKNRMAKGIQMQLL